MSVLSKTENYEFNFSLTPENTPQTPYHDIGNQPLANIHINDLSLATDSGKSFPKSAKISKQKVIVITGASSGIGLALGEKFGRDKK